MYFIANWKSYLSVPQAVKLLRDLLRWEKQHPWSKKIHVLVAPSVAALPAAAEVLRGQRTAIKLAAQDVGLAAAGAFTGNIAPRELKYWGVRSVLVGHSERRQYFKEDDSVIAKKTALLLASGLQPILCVGETKEERQSGRAQAVVQRQLAAVGECPSVVAYEPRWAIGTGVPIAPPDAAEMQAYIWRQCKKKAAVCYGGSVTPENILQFVTQDSGQGVLVGGAATKFSSLTKMLTRLTAQRGG